MITKEQLLEKRYEYERQEQQALANANAAHGAMMAIDSLIAQLSEDEKAVNDDSASSNTD